MPRRRQQRKKVSKFEFSRKKEQQVRFDGEFLKDPEERRYRFMSERSWRSGETKGGEMAF